MEFENPSHLEDKCPDPQVVFAAGRIIGPPPPADNTQFDTGPKFDYPPTKEVTPGYDPQVNENGQRVRITTIIAQPPR